MKMPWVAAGSALLAGALAAGAVDWTVSVRRAEVKPAPAPFEKPVKEMILDDDFEGVQEGDWVRIVEDKRSVGYIHRSLVAEEGEELQDPSMSFRILGTSYPDDVMVSDMVADEWVRNPVVRDTGPAPRAWGLQEFRANGGLGGGK